MNNLIPLMMMLLVGITSVVGLTVVPMAFGATEWVTIETDKEAYLDGDIINVSGTVFQLYSSNPLTIMVIAPNNNVVYLDQITVNSDRKFDAEFKAGGSLMKMFGDYKIIAQYGSESRKAEVTFQYGVPPVEKVIIPQPKQITVDGFVMSNSMTSGEVIAMSPIQESNMLRIHVHETIEPGTLTVAIPRAVLDSVVDNVDGEFFAFVNSENVHVTEVDSNEYDRTLMIEYPAGTTIIEIIGTHAIPEFGAFVLVGLVVGTVAVVMLTRGRTCFPTE